MSSGSGCRAPRRVGGVFALAEDRVVESPRDGPDAALRGAVGSAAAVAERDLVAERDRARLAYG
jgi:hypothetical protein